MPILTFLQKQELAKKYMAEKKICFGNEQANERAEEMFIDALTHREQVHQHTINSFTEVHLLILRAAWDEIYKYKAK